MQRRKSKRIRRKRWDGEEVLGFFSRCPFMIPRFQFVRSRLSTGFGDRSVVVGFQVICFEDGCV